jgi:hypothetical protein
MTARAGRSGGLILTSSQRSPELAVWPHRFQAKTIAELLSHDAERFMLDHDLINGMFSPMAIRIRLSASACRRASVHFLSMGKY